MSATFSQSRRFADIGSHLVDAETTIPTIRISTESGREEKTATAAKVNGRENVNGESALEGPQQHAQVAAGDSDGESKDATLHNGPGVRESFAFSNKRLCERWVDSLFVVLYEVSWRYGLRWFIVGQQGARTSVVSAKRRVDAL
jgi:hypothetical protein